MAISNDSDRESVIRGFACSGSLLSSHDELKAGIRVTRAQFARMMGCSRQAVTEWVRDSRIQVGVDGRFDPSKAVADLLRTGDPGRIRARVLKPIFAEISECRARISSLESELEKTSAAESDFSRLKSDCAFYEGAADELLLIINGLIEQLPRAWPELVSMPSNEGATAIMNWLRQSIEFGASPLVLARQLVEGEGEDLLNQNQEVDDE